MGSSKKHKKDRESSKKHRHRSRSRSHSVESVDRDRDRERRHRKRKRDRTPEKVVKEREYQSDSSDCVEVPVDKKPAPSRAARSPSPVPDGGVGDCLSIAETNKLRAKLGLKPLEVEQAPESSSRVDEAEEKSGNKKLKDDWGEFYHKPANNIASIKGAEKIREKIKERREKRKLEEKLMKTKTLGESDEDDDINKWVERNRIKALQKKEAEKRAKMLQEMDDEFGVSDLVDQEQRDRRREAYKGQDLKGLKVEHDLSEFKEGRDVILTLKDADVLDEEGDTLVNVNIQDSERYRKNVENKKLKPGQYGYNCYDEELDEFGTPVSRAILKKYDDEIDKTKTSFTLGQNERHEQEQRRRLLEIKCKLENKRLESLNEQLIRPATDYYTEEEMTKFKKPKKKVKKIRSRVKADDLLPLDGDSASKDLAARTLAGDEEDVKMNYIVDQEQDLERVLAKARRLKQKEALIVKTLPANLKVEMKEEPEDDSRDALDNHMILNETAEFCRTLGDIPTYGMAGNREVDLNDLMEADEEMPEASEAHDEDERRTGTWNSVKLSEEVMDDAVVLIKETAETAILDEEPDLGTGVAGALRLAMSKGYLEKEESNKPSNSRMAYLQAKNYSIEDKAHAEDDKFGRRDRYSSGPVSDFKEKETFKPNVKLEYIDDSGRLLNTKEAFRYLSHKFHGKGPGKNKIEKRLKKSEQEGLMKQMSSTDTPLGTLNMLQAKQKETHSPFIVLSGGKQQLTSSSIIKQSMK